MSEWIRTGQALKAFHQLSWSFVTSEHIRKMVDAGEFEGIQIGEGLNYRIGAASLGQYLRRKAGTNPRLAEALALLASPKKTT